MTGALSGCRGGPVRSRGRSFFARQPMALEEPRQGRGRSGNAALNQTGAKFLKALVTLLLERRHDDRVPRLDPSGPRVAALRLRGEAARLPARRVPADHRRHRHPEATRRRATAHPAIHGRKRPRPQIHGKWPAHPVTPITASRARNQTSANLGILVTDSNRKGDALALSQSVNRIGLGISPLTLHSRIYTNLVDGTFHSNRRPVCLKVMKPFNEATSAL